MTEEKNLFSVSICDIEKSESQPGAWRLTPNERRILSLFWERNPCGGMSASNPTLIELASRGADAESIFHLLYLYWIAQRWPQDGIPDDSEMLVALDAWRLDVLQRLEQRADHSGDLKEFRVRYAEEGHFSAGSNVPYAIKMAHRSVVAILGTIEPAERSMMEKYIIERLDVHLVNVHVYSPMDDEG